MTERTNQLVGLTDTFRTAFGGADPERLIRAPGRVNLIGEHTDYNGLPVFPIAIQYAISIVSRTRSDAHVRLVNRDARFDAVEFELSDDIPHSPPGHWGNYVKAAAQALYRDHGVRRGFDGVLESTVPVATGLSSSSALVVSSGLTLLEHTGTAVDRMQLMDEFARAEVYVGTKSGGMDQAICVGAKPGHACRIDFAPLRLQHVPVPDGWTFVVASTLIRAEKSGAAKAAYNQRTEECRAALDAVSEVLDGARRTNYAALMNDRSVDELLAVADRALDAPLLERFRHVVTEADRLVKAIDAMQRNDSAHFGRLMVGSHESLRDDYEVSCAELDQLVELCMAAGAHGARLTGAGFGGCIVALTAEDRAADLLAALTEGYYASRLDGPPSARELFIAVPSGGASSTML
jgi:galactokinase